eukprot:3999890-Amphidinium_carterae.1
MSVLDPEDKLVQRAAGHFFRTRKAPILKNASGHHIGVVDVPSWCNFARRQRHRGAVASALILSPNY